MTNSRLTASAIDWLDELAPKRSFPVIVWDREFLQSLTAQLYSDVSSRLDSTVSSIHRLLVSQWRSHRKPHLQYRYDPRLDKTHQPSAAEDFPYFVDREAQLDQLLQVSSYSVAVLTGPAGIGKTVLIQHLLSRLERLKRRGVVVRLDRIQSDDLMSFALPIARAIDYHFSDESLTRQLTEYLWEESQSLIDSMAAALRRCALYLLVDNVHALSPSSDIAWFLEDFARDTGASWLLMTSRNADLWAGALVVPDLSVSIQGFERADIEAYFAKRRMRVPDAITNWLAERYQGWPILVSLCGNRVGLECLEETVPEQAVLGALTERLFGGLTSEARALFAHVAALHADLGRTDLRALVGLSAAAFDRAWQELATTGLINPLEPFPTCVHELLKHIFLRGDSGGRAIDRQIGEFLLAFDADPERTIAALHHFLRAEEWISAAKVIVARQQGLIRSGMVAPLMDVLASIEPHRVTEELYGELIVVRSRCQETLGLVAEAFDSLETFFPAEIDVGETVGPPALARYLCQRARCLYFLARYQEAGLCIKGFHESIESWDPRRESRAACLLTAEAVALEARLLHVQRELRDAERLYHKALDYYKRGEDRIGENAIRYRLAMIAALRGEWAEARKAFERVLAEARRSSDAKREAYALHRLGIIRRRLGEFAAARELHLASLTIKQRIGHRRGYIYSFIELGEVAMAMGDLEDARQQLALAFNEAASLSMPKELALVYQSLARLRLRSGDHAEFRAWCLKAWRTFDDLGLNVRATKVLREMERETDEQEPN